MCPRHPQRQLWCPALVRLLLLLAIEQVPLPVDVELQVPFQDLVTILRRAVLAPEIIEVTPHGLGVFELVQQQADNGRLTDLGGGIRPEHA